MAIPPLSKEKLQEARQAATEARRRRASVKAQLREGVVTIAEVIDLASSDDVVAHMKVLDALKSIPRVGEKRAGEIMARLEIAPNRRLRGLGHHQVAGLRQEFTPGL